MPDWIEDRPGGVLIRARVKPRAKKNAIEGATPDGRLAVRLAAPPVDNKANKALLALLSKTLGVPKSKIAIVAGDKSREKTVAVEGISAQEARKSLGLE